ncbi:unnamed protein product [Paramecium sonneborni]|uniref:Mini antigen n=1 Tax=Paramecium sonneborni TaxID=65129 RepID=A0A8S1JY05_9CILI|nr:unnamed protein product [Paramecium sonneborni]
MNKFILAIVLFSIAYAQLTFNANNKCACNQLSTQQDCVQSFPICIWDSKSSSCSTQTCSTITDQLSCASNLKCMFNGKSCVDFTLCNQITGVDQAECRAKSQNCPQSDGKNCASKELLKSCSAYTSQSSCDGVLSSNGFCYWTTGGVCSEISSCSQLSSNVCTNIGNACQWNNTINNCTQAGCGQFTNNYTCTKYLTQLNKEEFQLCQWNNSSCVNANDISSLNINTCYNQTLQTYRWVSSSNTCEICAGKLIYVLIMAVLMTMI